MSDQLLRQYERWECLGDGYPQAWSKKTNSGLFWLGHPDGVSVLHPPIKDLIREQAGHRCLRCGHPYRSGDPEISKGGEWSPCDESCTHGGPLRVWFDTPGIEWQHFESMVGLEGKLIQAQWRILTVHHLDEDKANCRWWNLAALCQRCHLRMQRAVVMDRVYHYSHSTWFKPYAAGFYGWKYLKENLSREEVEARMEELLALEHRFTQETLL